jgi:type I restriction enzyme M protein
MGDKRREITNDHIAEIYQLYARFESNERCKIFATTDFGYRKVTIERPLRLNFEATPERLQRLTEQPAFAGLAQSRKKDPAEKASEDAAGRARQAQILAQLARLPQTRFTDRPAFEAALDALGAKFEAPIRKAILTALSERDETAAICYAKDGSPEPDPDLRDTENVPLGEDIETYFAREVAPHLPDAWINTTLCDPQDGRVGRVGYEINFNRYFYTYQPPRSLQEIEAEILALQTEIGQLLGGV